MSLSPPHSQYINRLLGPNRKHLPAANSSSDFVFYCHQFWGAALPTHLVCGSHCPLRLNKQQNITGRKITQKLRRK